ncbi:MAG: hypothetical protein R3D03_01525 [Geminicoccaceae bacterium]
MRRSPVPGLCAGYRDRSRPVLFGALDFGFEWIKFPFDEVTHRIDDQLLFIGECKVHGRPRAFQDLAGAEVPGGETLHDLDQAVVLHRLEVAHRQAAGLGIDCSQMRSSNASSSSEYPSALSMAISRLGRTVP